MRLISSKEFAVNIIFEERHFVRRLLLALKDSQCSKERE